jgi:hypothetical protein
VEGYRSRRPIRRADLAAVPLFRSRRGSLADGHAARNTHRWGRWWVNDSYFDFHLKFLWEWSTSACLRLK